MGCSCASEDSHSDLLALADKLAAPMHAHSRDLRRYMAETTVPVVRRVREVHDVLEDEGRFGVIVHFLCRFFCFWVRLRGRGSMFNLS